MAVILKHNQFCLRNSVYGFCCVFWFHRNIFIALYKHDRTSNSVKFRHQIYIHSGKIYRVVLPVRRSYTVCRSLFEEIIYYTVKVTGRNREQNLKRPLCYPAAYEQ